MTYFSLPAFYLIANLVYLILFLFKIEIKIKPVVQGWQLSVIKIVHNRDQEQDLD